MTEKSITPQQLLEFVDNLLDDVKTGRITPEGALVAGQQYEYLRGTLTEHSEAITGAFSDDKKFTSAITGALEEALARVRRELPQFQNEMPKQPFSPETIVTRAKAFHVAREDSVSAISLQQARVATLKNNFIDRLVNNWIAQTRTTIDKEKQQSMASEIREKLEKAPLDAMSPTEMRGFVQKTLAGFRQEVGPAEKELVDETKKLTGLYAIPTALVSRSDISHPEWFTSIAIQTALSSFVAPKELISRAYTLTRQAEAIAPSAQQEKGVPVANVFFRAFASTATQRVFAVAADALLDQLSPFARQEVIKAAFSRALEGALVKTDVLTGRLGREFVESELFRFVTDSARKEFAQSGGGIKQARGALDDIIGSVLRGPITAQLVGTPKEMILSYFELLKIEAGLPANRKVLFPEHAPTVNALFTTHAPRPTSHGSIVALTAKLPSWQTLYVALLLGFAPSLLSSSGGQHQTSVGVVRGAGPLGVVGGVFTSLGRVLSGATVGLAGGLLTTLFGGGLGALFGRNRGPERPTPLLEDTPKLLAIFIVVTIVILFIFPSFLNAPFINNVAKMGSLFVASQEIPDFSGESNPSPDLSLVASECKGQDLPPPSADGVKTTQIGGRTYAFPIAPYDKTYYTCGHHDGLQATDMGINGVETGEPHVGLAVVAYTDGVIDSTVLNDPRGGKYVILNGSNGESYYYAHNCSLYVKKGDRVSAGQVIAATGNTGSAAGTPEHLHFAMTATGGDFYNGGDTCPAKDFKEKFGIGKCGATPFCPSKPPNK
ncbi:MAG: M23 family metallopeptidase [Patescibacteria group bacterium]